MRSLPHRDRSLDAGIRFRRLRMSIAIAGSMLLTGIAIGSASANAASIGSTLSTTPLVLKDGRIAEVSVHTVPFPEDGVAPQQAIRAALDEFAGSIATDCFLTAQVIGHVGKEEISGRETADIHRLARARADTIQGALIEVGLPATSIASVWDWRFMVRQARVTLWVFRLTAGEDCEDKPLGGGSADQVASATAPEAPSASTITSAPLPSPGNVAESEERSIVQASQPKTKAKAREVTAPIPASPPRAEGLSDAAPEAGEASSGKAVVAALDRGTSEQNAAPPASGGEAIDIVFATNSSYLPKGAGERLRALLKTLDKGKSYVLRLQTSVDGAADVDGASASEAARYNAWLAERRSKRIEEWFENHGSGFDLDVKPSFLENDSSRRVRIETNPLG